MNTNQTSIPPGSWALVTGANGLVASHTIKQLLERGYKVRGTVRDLEKSAWLVRDVFKSYAERGDFQMVCVPDLGAENAFDGAVNGMNAIIHVATIGTFDPDPRKVITPTVSAVTSLLDAAQKEPSMKEFVYTSSMAACIITVPGDNTHVGQDTWNEVVEKLAWAPPPYEPIRPLVVYAASKVASEKALWKWTEENKPAFTVNSIIPVTILGEYLNKKHGETETSFVKLLYDGKTDTLTKVARAMIFVDVKDVALLHVAAVLDPEVKNRRIIAWGAHCNLNDVLAIMRKLDPERKFPEDIPGLIDLNQTTDPREPEALLKKWGNQDGFRSLEESVAANMTSIAKYYPGI